MNPPRFSILYADPPWQFKPRGSFMQSEPRDRRPTGRFVPYRTMDTEAICALPVAELARPGRLQFMWVT